MSLRTRKGEIVDLKADPRRIAVFGGRHPVPGDEEYAEARRLGSLLAVAGFSVMNGGYTGVMEAVSRGAVESGGAAIGITMEIFGNMPPNPFLTQEIRARNFFERLEILSSTAGGFVAMRGGMGTLTEVSLIWNMLQTRTIEPKPMVLMGKFWKPLLRSVANHLVVTAEELDLLHYADNADEAVALLGR